VIVITEEASLPMELMLETVMIVMRLNASIMENPGTVVLNGFQMRSIFRERKNNLVLGITNFRPGRRG